MKILLIVSIPMLILCGCAAQKKQASSGPFQFPAFNKEGHRGTRGLMPENTLPAMYKAIDLGVNTLEIDIVFSKDKQVVVSHDVFFHQDITTTPSGKTLTAKEAQLHQIYQMDYDSVKRYDVGMKPHPDFPRQQHVPAYKPLFGELVDSSDAYGRKAGRLPMYNIELKTNPAYDGSKHPPVEEFVDRVMEIVRQKKLENRSYIQSFDFRPLQYVHKKYPGIITAVLISGSEKRTLQEQLAALGYKPEMYSPHFSIVTPALVKECHDNGIRIIPWTVNTPELMKGLKAMGVDGIITDYPDYFSQL